MINLVVAAVILIVIMLVFIFILFKNIIKRMDENAKKYFVNKMKDYDYILEEKQARLEEIKAEIEEFQSKNRNILQADECDENIEENKKQKQNKEDDEEDYDNDDTIKPTNKFDQEIKYNINVPEYREVGFFNNYKAVRRTFTVDNVKIIKKFIEEHKNQKEEKEYKILKRIRAKFDENAIYQCLTLSQTDQITVLGEVLTDTEKKTVKLEELTSDTQFNTKSLIDFIDHRLEEIEPTIYIYTSALENRNRYNSIDKNIVTLPYSNMSEGIIIRYRDKVYDFSI